MAAPVFDFVEGRKRFSVVLEKSADHDVADELQETFAEIKSSDIEKRLTLDQALRDRLNDLILQGASCDAFKATIGLAVSAVEHELCSASTPFLMLSDLFDSVTLDKCADIYTCVEDRVDTWKSDTFYTHGKNYLLRMCNDLLRRLSKSQHTLFCGRIQLFLARLFPLWEKSGLNLMSQFNLENVTYYNTKPEDYSRNRKQSLDSDRDKDESMEIEEGEMNELTSSSIPIDYNLYRKFWSLQDFFRRPLQCYEKVPWKTFTNHTEEVLNCFESFKLDDVKSAQNKLQLDAQSQTYFAKYLTSEKLLDLQLSDSTFRRYVLVQFLILFQYLNAPVKFKGSSHVLTDDQSNWIKQITDKVYKLIRETPSDGDKFSKTIEHILSREENWNNWKNEGCPSYVREKASEKPSTSRPRKRPLGDDLKASGGKFIKMGNSELTRLWNLCPDNLEACRADKRSFVPKLEEFFEEAIEQADPEQMVEEEYKLINNQTWGWKALRLLSQQSYHFFTSANRSNVRTMSSYLSEMLEKLAQELPGQMQGHNTTEDVRVEDDIGGEEGPAEEAIDRNDDQAKEDLPELVTSEQLENLADCLEADWKKLAMELNFPEEDISYFESESEETAKQALKMLTIWKENEADRATPGCLQTALREIGQVDISQVVFGAKDDNV